MTFHLLLSRWIFTVPELSVVLNKLDNEFYTSLSYFLPFNRLFWQSSQPASYCNLLSCLELDYYRAVLIPVRFLSLTRHNMLIIWKLKIKPINTASLHWGSKDISVQRTYFQSSYPTNLLSSRLVQRPDTQMAFYLYIQSSSFFLFISLQNIT